jgi:hypothetical protein
MMASLALCLALATLGFASADSQGPPVTAALRSSARLLATMASWQLQANPWLSLTNHPRAVYYSIVSKSTWFGPDTSGSAGTTFSDLNYLLK